MSAILERKAMAVALPKADASPLAALRLPIGAWLRLLWNVAPPLLQLPSEGGEGPFLADGGVHLPPAPALPPDVDAAHWYSAAAAHAAAHIVFSRRVFVREGLAPITQALLGLLEDARVEALACRELPGLRRLWAPMHTVRPEDGDDVETLLLRLARALLDPACRDPHPWVRKGRSLFFLDVQGEVLAQTRPVALRQLASRLGNDIGQMRLGFNARTYRPGPGYRDDNRWLWQGGVGEQGGAPQPSPASARRSDGPTDTTPPSPLEWRYPEWDRLIGRLRPDWCTVRERPPLPGPLLPATPNDPALRRRWAELLRRSAGAARGWRRREREGDDIEVDEALHVALAARSGEDGDARVHRRLQRTSERVAAVLLVDCSASSALAHADSGITRLAWQQHGVRLLADAMTEAGWRFALHGFASDGRHAVEVRRIKGFDEAWDEAALQRLGGLRSGLSTRLGGVLRHATDALLSQVADRRLVLAMGDGEVHDIDIHDPRYLVEDAQQAVRTARLAGVRCVALVLEEAGLDSARRIFGSRQAGLVAGGGLRPALLARLLAG